MEDQIEVSGINETTNPTNEGILANYEGLAADETVVTTIEGNEEQVLEFLEENAIYSTQEIEINGQRLIVAQGEGGNQYYYYVGDDQTTSAEQTVAFVESDGLTETTMPAQCADNTKLVMDDDSSSSRGRSNVLESSLDPPSDLTSVAHVTSSAQEYHPMIIPSEGLTEVTVKNSSDELWTASGEEKVDEKDDMTEVLFFPHSKLTSKLMLSPQDERNRKLLQLARIAQEMEPELATVEFDASESEHQMTMIESVGSVTIQQQEENVSSSCEELPTQEISECLTTDNENEMPIADELPDTGLDLSIHKVEKGVSVIHVTSSSDFSDPNQNEVIDNTHYDIVETENIYSEEQNVVFDGREHRSDDMEEGYEIIDDTEEIDLNANYQLSEVQHDFPTNPSAAEVFVYSETNNQDQLKGEETLLHNDGNNSRASSVLMYSRKEVHGHQEIDQEIAIVMDDESLHPVHSVHQSNLEEEECTIVTDVMAEESVQESEYATESSMPADNTDPNVHNIVLDNNNIDDPTFEKNIKSQLELVKDSSDVMETLSPAVQKMDTNQNLIVYELDSTAVQPSASFFLKQESLIKKPAKSSSKKKKSVDDSDTTDLTVLKSPQKTYSRRTRSTNKPLKADKTPVDTQVPSNSISGQNNELVSDDIKGTQYETSSNVLNIESDRNAFSGTSSLIDAEKLANDQVYIFDDPIIDPKEFESNYKNLKKADNKSAELAKTEGLESSAPLFEENRSLRIAEYLINENNEGLMGNSITVIKPPQITYNRRSRRLNKSSKADTASHNIPVSTNTNDSPNVTSVKNDATSFESEASIVLNADVEQSGESSSSLTITQDIPQEFCADQISKDETNSELSNKNCPEPEIGIDNSAPLFEDSSSLATKFLMKNDDEEVTQTNVTVIKSPQKKNSRRSSRLKKSSKTNIANIVQETIIDDVPLVDQISRLDYDSIDMLNIDTEQTDTSNSSTVTHESDVKMVELSEVKESDNLTAANESLAKNSGTVKPSQQTYSRRSGRLSKSVKLGKANIEKQDTISEMIVNRPNIDSEESVDISKPLATASDILATTPKSVLSDLESSEINEEISAEAIELSHAKVIENLTLLFKDDDADTVKTSENSNDSLSSNAGVGVKPPQKTYSRRSGRLNKSLKSDKLTASIKTSSNSSSDAKTSPGVEEIIKDSPGRSTLKVSNIESDKKMNNSKSSDITDDISKMFSENQSVTTKAKPQSSKLNSEQCLESVAKTQKLAETSVIEKADVVTEASATKEPIIQPPKKTYLRKRKQMQEDAFTEVLTANEVATSSDGDIELFSCADLDDNTCSENMSSTQSSECHGVVPDISSKTLSSDDDSLIFTSDIRSKGSATYKRRKTLELKTNAVKPPSPVQVDNSVDADPIMDIESIKEVLQEAVIATEASAVTNQTELSDVANANDVLELAKEALGDTATSSEKVSSPVPEAAFVPLRSKRIRKPKIDRQSQGETPAKSRRQSGVSKNVATTPHALDIENDVNEITATASIAPPVKKPKRVSSSFRNPETAFYPSVKFSFLKKSGSLKKSGATSSKKQTSLGSSRSKLPAKPMVLNYANGTLTRRQLNDKINEYNFSDSDETHSDNQDTRGYSSDPLGRKKRFKPYTSKNSKNKMSDCTVDWDKFRNSPVKVRTNRYLPKIKRRVARLSTDGNETLRSPGSIGPKVTFAPLPQLAQQEESSSPDESQLSLDDDFCRFRIQDSPKKEKPDLLYECLNCEFETRRVRNYMYHLKECLKSLIVNQDEMKNMDRRQQIRGTEVNITDTVPSEESGGKSTFTSNDDNLSDVEVDDETLNSRLGTEFEYAKDDIVWAELKRVYWPALVRRVYPEERKVTIFFIDSPCQNGKKKCLKVNISYLQSYNNAEINKKLLTEGKEKAYGDAFVKAVQKAEDFVRKRKCLGMNISVAQFFKTVEFANEEHNVDDSDTEDDDQYLDILNLVADIVDYLKSGAVNDHLIGIFNEVIESERHTKFFSIDPAISNELANKPWFGPIDNLREQTDLYEYFFALFKKKCKLEDRACTLRYVYQVWCPEAVVKAISVLKNVTASEAEQIFNESNLHVALKNDTGCRSASTLVSLN